VKTRDQKFRFQTPGAVGAICFFLGLSVYFQSIGLSPILSLLLLFFGVHLIFLKADYSKLFLNLGLLLALIFFTAHFFKTYTSFSLYYVPVASVVMLTALLYNDLQLSFSMALLAAVLVCLVTGQDLKILLTFFTGGLTASLCVQGARTRGQLLAAGLYIGVIQVTCMILLNPNLQTILSRAFFMVQLKPLLMNGIICAFITLTFLKIFETTFGVVTNFSLLELADFNHPLLKRMIMEAPGTYHHSLIVSNLSEAAADEIGANPLLTRVGAYYHDIGKLVKPEYFTENQLLGRNKHDLIEPSISRLVIINHVKEGIEMGRKYRLNPLIINFIPEHHGTGLMHYFYQKALEEAKDEKDVSPDNYRYPGPKPQSKETAVVMLADSVEGATRALEEPDPKSIEDIVRKVINNKFID